jgi:hypothetical protein
MKEPTVIIVELAGKRFGRLTAIERVGSDGSNAFWKCICECGKETQIRTCHLRSGKVRSCGCGPKGRHRYEHGMTGTRVYGIYRQMHQRCENPNAEGYENYGGRGIAVCEEWNNFPQFFEDMGEPPSVKYTLDRIDVNAGYSKENCKWSTYKEQHRNRRDNSNITAFGKTQCVTAWAEEYEMPVSTLRNRLNRANMAPEDALTVPLLKKRKE